MKKAIAPGKLILSGEHAVVHGHPALAMAVDHCAQASMTTDFPRQVFFDLLNLSYQKAHHFHTLKQIKHRVQKKYEAFLRGDYSIKDVLKKPMELTQYALTSVLEKLNLTLQDGIRLSTHSSIPVGCGMGSSAATILSVLHVIAQHFKLELNGEKLLSLAMEIESLQHGYSSGLDLRVSLNGGCLWFHEGNGTARSLPSLPMYLVNSGKPETGTGECVIYAAPFFKKSDIGNDFSAVTYQMDKEIQENHLDGTMNAIRENHQLLIKIGVVPNKVQRFISHVESHQGAAKICGAGAIRGEQAGAILIVSETDPAEICAQYGYTSTRIFGQEHGLRAA